MNKFFGLALAALSTVGIASTAALAQGVGMTSDQSFAQDVLQSRTPVVVDFYADWCGPCRRMMPVVDQVASQYAGQVKFYRVNVDNSPNVAGRYRVSSIPTIAIFNGGRLVGETTGAESGAQLSAQIQQALSRHVASR